MQWLYDQYATRINRNLLFILYLFCFMIDNVLAGLNPSFNQGQSYYFQLYPLSLTIVGKDSTVPAPGTTYRFTIVKGQQKFDETKLPIEANYKKVNGANLMIMPKCPINFYVPNFVKQRKYEENQEYFIAEQTINIDPYVEQYKSARTVRFQHKSKFSEDYELEYEIYMQKSRFALQKVVKDYKYERSLKSPLRERKQTSPTATGKKSEVAKRTLVTSNIKDNAEKSEKFNGSEKSPRQQLTEIQSTKNKKLDQSERSYQVPKKTDLRDSRKSGSAVKPIKKQEAPQTTARSNIEPEEPRRSGVRQAPKSEAAEKTEKAASVASSKKEVPVVEVRFKPVAKSNAVGEVKMAGSQRLGQTIVEQEVKPKADGEEKANRKEKIILILFFIASVFLMYYSMHPNKRV